MVSLRCFEPVKGKCHSSGGLCSQHPPFLARPEHSIIHVGFALSAICPFMTLSLTFSCCSTARMLAMQPDERAARGVSGDDRVYRRASLSGLRQTSGAMNLFMTVPLR
jgi:hypothetical protein